MQPRTYLLLLHDAVRSHIASLGSRQRRRLREKLEYLQHGMWDTGVRVKKLRGGRLSFEARLSRGDRILFTLGRPPAATAGGGAAASADAARIYVWGVVKHDDVAAAERRIVAANAPFLDFHADEVERLPDLVLDDLPDEHFGPALERPLSVAPAGSRADRDDSNGDAAAPQRWLVVDDEEWRRLVETADPDGVQLYLFLTGEQARLLRSEPPVLLSGTAGSGKTTVAVYYLLRHRARQLAGGEAATPDAEAALAAAAGDAHTASFAAARERALFVTGSPHLKRFSERIYRGLVAATELEAAPDAARFATFTELLNGILRLETRASAQPPAGLPEFHAIYRSQASAARYDAELVWEEIRSIIKGAKPPVSRRRFAELADRLGRSQATMRDRAELAEYLVRLGNLELGDRLDAVRERKTSFTSLQQFAASVRDASAARHSEQMFVLDAALRLLDKQADRLDQPLLTLREYESLGRKRAPNFPFDRRDIYRIAEYYQDRLQQTSRVDEIDLTRAALQRLEQDEDSFRYDLVVCDEVQDFTDVQLALLFRLAADPLRTVLAGDPKQIINPSGFRWEEVRARYYERGLRVPEVVNLSVNFRSVGNIVALANELLKLKRSLVGLASGEIAERWTFRGRPPLLVDGLAEPTMLQAMKQAGASQVVLVRTPAERDRLRAALATELVFTINDAKGLEFDGVLLWRFAESEGSAARWRRIAREHHLGESERPRIRHELNLLYVAVTRARNTLVVWDGTEAGPVWSIDGLAGHMLRSGDAEALSTVWQRVSSPAEWEAQGDYFFDREHFAAAEECYRNAAAQAKEALARAHRLERTGDHRAAAALFSAHGNAERAAENLERGSAHRESAREWRRAGNERRALRCDALHFETARRYVKAAACWAKLGDTERMLGIWERGGEHRLLADHYLGLKKSGKAAHHLKLLGDHGAAAVCFRRAGMIECAADAFEKDGQHLKAAPLYRRLGNAEALTRCLLRGGEFHGAGLAYEKLGDLDRTIECFRSYAEASDANRLDLERRLVKISPKRPGVKAAVRMAALGRHRDAAEILGRRSGHLTRAVALYRRAGDFATSAACLASHGHYREAAGEIARSGQPERLGQAVEYLSEYGLETLEDRLRRVDQLNRSAYRLRASGEHERALAHFIALHEIYGAPVHTGFLDEACREYAKLDRHEDAIGFFFKHLRVEEAEAYLAARPDLTMPLDRVERLAQLGGSEGTLWTLPGDCLRIVMRLLHRCLYCGDETDRHERVAAILATMPTYYLMTARLSGEMGEMLIDLRLVNAIVAALTPSALLMEDERREWFLDRVTQAARETGDPELMLCAQMDQPESLTEGLRPLQPSERNYLLFALSPTRFGAAVEVLRSLDDIAGAVKICRMHGDRRRAAEVLEQAGDVKAAAREYRDGGHYAEARRCYQTIGDEIGLARVYEREGRFQKALAIWGRRGRTRDVVRVTRKLAQRAQLPLLRDEPEHAPYDPKRAS